MSITISRLIITAAPAMRRLNFPIWSWAGRNFVCERAFSTASMDTVKPQRSVLYLPGANTKAIAKSRTLPADVLILDLEDGVAPDAKTNARQQIAQALSEGFGHRQVVVRANGLDTPWGLDDLTTFAKSGGVDAIAIPKVEQGSTIVRVHEILSKNNAPANLQIWGMIETPKGVLNVQEICQTGTSEAAGKRMTALIMGTSDLTKDLRAKHTNERLPLLTSLQLTLLAARAYGLACFDGVHLDIENTEQLKLHCKQAADMGFDGKTLIHPKQIGAANEAFSAGEEEVAECREIVEVYKQALAAGKGVAVVRGKLIEDLHVRNAERILKLHEAVVAYQRLAGGSKA